MPKPKQKSLDQNQEKPLAFVFWSPELDQELDAREEREKKDENNA